MTRLATAAAVVCPEVTVLEEQRWVDEADVVTSAGMDMSLHLVEQIAGAEVGGVDSAADGLWVEGEGGIITFSSIKEALFLAHKFQRLPFNTEQYRLLMVPPIVDLERMAEIHSEMGKRERRSTRTNASPSYEH